jgi:hypothetical protein
LGEWKQNQKNQKCNKLLDQAFYLPPRGNTHHSRYKCLNKIFVWIKRKKYPSESYNLLNNTKMKKNVKNLIS